MPRHTVRRTFVVAMGSTLVAGLSVHATGDERPPVTKPRATDGDDRFEPNWDERLTVTLHNGVGEPGNRLGEVALHAKE